MMNAYNKYIDAVTKKLLLSVVGSLITVFIIDYLLSDIFASDSYTLISLLSLLFVYTLKNVEDGLERYLSMVSLIVFKIFRLVVLGISLNSYAFLSGMITSATLFHVFIQYKASSSTNTDNKEMMTAVNSLIMGLKPVAKSRSKPHHDGTVSDGLIERHKTTNRPRISKDDYPSERETDAEDIKSLL